MRRALTCVALCGFAGAALAQGPVKPVVTHSDYDVPELLKQLQVPTDVFRGRVLWVQRCALCHDGLGQPSYQTIGPWIDADTLKNLGEPALRAIIAAGGAQDARIPL